MAPMGPAEVLLVDNITVFGGMLLEMVFFCVGWCDVSTGLRGHGNSP